MKVISNLNKLYKHGLINHVAFSYLMVLCVAKLILSCLASLKVVLCSDFFNKDKVLNHKRIAYNCSTYDIVLRGEL